MNRSSRVRLSCMALAAALGLAPAATAQVETHHGWRLAFQVAALDLETSISGSGGTGTTDEITFGGGVGVNAEYRFSRRLGLDLGVLAGGGLNVSVKVTGGGAAPWYSQDSFTFTPVTVGLDVHLMPEGRVDVYVAPVVAAINYGSIFVRIGNGRVSTGVEIDSDVAWGATVGLGVTFPRQRWSFESRLTYLDSRLEGHSPPGIRIDSDCDAILFGVGFGYRF